MSVPRSKPNKSTTIKEKIKIIEDVEAKLSYTEIARKHKVSKSSISDYIRNKESIRRQYLQGKQNKCREKPPKFANIEDKLYTDFLRLKDTTLPVSTTWIKERALKIANELTVTEFKASSQWVRGFMKRHNLTIQQMCGESAKVSTDEVNLWMNSHEEEISKYSPENIFNCDETGFFYRCLPNRTVSLKGSKCHGGTKSKERITVLLCCNMSGSEKLELLVIGKSAQPRCFPKKTTKHHSVSKLGCHYRNQTKAWMNREIFGEWLLMLEEKFSNENRNILLLLDNFSGHKIPEFETSSKHVKLLFLPENTTSVTQPLDQGIISNLKVIYKRDLLNLYWAQLVSPGSQSKLSEINLLQAIHLLVSSWKSVEPKTIANCFRRALPGIHSTDLLGEEEPDKVVISPEIAQRLLPPSLSFEEFAFADNNLFTSDEMVSDEATSQTENDETDLMEVDETEEETPVQISHVQVISALQTVLKYTSFGDQSNPKVNSFISSYLRDSVIPVYISEKKQTTIRDFFKPK